MKYEKIKGTNDILPVESYLWKNAILKLHDVFSLYGFKFEISPILEPYELFVRSIGESSEVVKKEMFTFLSKSGKNIALKPEETAVLMRSLIENNYIKSGDFEKLYYITPLFRYERPQKGRYREFYQFGIEVLNSVNPIRDAEIIIVGDKILREFNISGFTIELNSIGCRECRKNYTSKLVSYLSSRENELCNDCRVRLVENPLRILDCKNNSCRHEIKDAPKTYENLCSGCETDFEIVKKHLDINNIRFSLNSSIVRGLDYYSKTVFEFVEKGEKLGSQSTLIGGGRYDYLSEELGGKSMPSCGFAGGLERLLLSISDKNKKEIIENETCRALMIHFGNESLIAAEKLANELRANKISVEIMYETDKIKKQFKYASDRGILFAVVIGEDELKENKVVVKNLLTGEQIKADNDADGISKILKRGGDV